MTDWIGAAIKLALVLLLGCGLSVLISVTLEKSGEYRPIVAVAMFTGVVLVLYLSLAGVFD